MGDDSVADLPIGLDRPDRRRSPQTDPVVYRLRVDLDDATPPIWRRVDVRSDVTLEVMHQVLQVAFSWDDYHLYRFSLGGHAFDRDSQLFLCPYDVDNPDWEDSDAGLPAAAVRLDETMGEPGDVLQYVYDFGDNWELTLRLEEILAADASTPTAVVVDGQRAAPPEDCGGRRDEAELAEVLDDPARFDIDQVDAALRGPYFLLREAGFDRQVVDLVYRLECTPVGADLTPRVGQIVEMPSGTVDPARYLGAYQWFLDRAKDDGIPLTASGYLKPADVEASSKVVPGMGDWPGVPNREVHCLPLLQFRQNVQRLGLLRKNKGMLVLTRAGAAAQRDPQALWNHLAGRLLPDGEDGFDAQATVLLLVYAASSPDSHLPYAKVTAALAELGWRYPDGRTPGTEAVYHLPVRSILANTSDRPASWSERDRVSAGAAALARAALRGGS